MVELIKDASNSIFTKEKNEMWRVFSDLVTNRSHFPCISRVACEAKISLLAIVSYECACTVGGCTYFLDKRVGVSEMLFPNL